MISHRMAGCCLSMLIRHGTKDLLVPVHQSELLAAALAGAGCDVTFVKVVGGGHGFGAPEAGERTRLFLEKHLLGRKVTISAEAIPEGGRK